MPFNGSGKFVLAAGNPVSAGAIISEATHNSTMADIAANGLSNSITRDGQSTIISDLPLNNKKITMLANGVSATDAATVGQLQSGLASMNGGLISNTPAGNISATNVQAALNELDAEKVNVTEILANGRDLNTVVKSGPYRIGNTPVNAWPVGQNGQMIVSSGADTIAQIGISHATSDTYIRAGSPPEVGGSGAFTPWRKVLMAGDVESKNIGEPFPLWTHLAGVVPPSNAGTAKYIKLTAGLSGAGQYNNGLLTSESVSGSAPTVSATAVISLAGSPMNGVTVELVNTSRRFMRSGNSGAKESSDNKSHTHTFDRMADGTNASSGPFGSIVNAVSRISVSTGSSGGTEVKVYSIGVDKFMRIL